MTRFDFTELILVRHGETTAKNVLIGRTDPPLSPEGDAGMRELAGKLSGERIEAVYSSTLIRAVKSAEILAEPRGLEITPVRALSEMDMGSWDGRSFSDIMKWEPEAVQAFWADVENRRAPGGESLRELAARVIPAVSSIVEMYRGHKVCVVAHGGVNRVILFAALGLSLGNYYSVEQKHCAVNRIKYFCDGNTVVTLVNG